MVRFLFPWNRCDVTAMFRIISKSELSVQVLVWHTKNSSRPAQVSKSFDFVSYAFMLKIVKEIESPLLIVACVLMCMTVVTD